MGVAITRWELKGVSHKVAGGNGAISPGNSEVENGYPGDESCKRFRIIVGREGEGDDGSPKLP